MANKILSFILCFIFLFSEMGVFCQETLNEGPAIPSSPNMIMPPFVMPNMPPGFGQRQIPEGALPDEAGSPEIINTEEPPAEAITSEVYEEEPPSSTNVTPAVTAYKPVAKETPEKTVTKGAQTGSKASVSQPPAKSNKELRETNDGTISLDLKGVDVVDVLKMLASRSSLNIVVGKNVRGKVTIFLNDVDLWDAFEIILASNELAFDKRGDIINVMTERDYELIYGEKFNDKTKIRIIKLQYAKASEVAKFLNQMKSRIGKIITDDVSNTIILIDNPVQVMEMEDMVAKLDTETETRVFSLDYAKAEDLKVKINDLITKGSGILQVDERTNKIVVTDTRKKLEEIENVINAFDEKHKEVLIDAEIMEVNLTDETKMGINWQELLKKYNGLTLSSLFSYAAAGGAGPIGELAVGTLTSDGYQVLIQVLQSIGKTKTLSRPRIVALNNQEAKILVGTKQPYTTDTVVQPASGTATTATNVTFVDVGIKLYVTPTINNEDFITMKIRPEVSSSSSNYTTTANVKIPIVNTSEVETSVMVKDGLTIVIGGLMKDIDDKQKKQIPFLGDIPFIGRAFQQTDNTITQQEIVIFLTPHIITGDRYNATLANVETTVKMSKTSTTKEKEIDLIPKPLKPKQHVIKIPEPKPQIIEKVVEKPVVKVKEVVKEVPKVITKEIPISEPSNILRSGSSYGYYEVVRDKVLRYTKVNSPTENLQGDVKVYFKVDPEGKLMGEPKILNEVDSKLGNLVRQNVENAAPFPSFPKNLGKDSQTFVLTISYE